ncbi:MAG TPA: hypothetical protein VM802_10195 [Chitinophaga sp.]|uniref:hypothetical protein n=1 Tax=Chitinophaga sp. TaxID=1869181 RepID=UPI002B9EECB9|nr:hypothetical protein [Chitinophaga sp.]HVI45233.1 hypothetical protein [Chitinophaga sp.]
MPLVEDKYDPQKINHIRRLLQRESDKGRAKDYEIIIDGFKVIPRTCDINEFDDYEQELTPDSRSISILIYDSPNTNRNTRYSFNRRLEPGKGLDGLGEVENLISQRLAENNREHELAQLREKLQQAEQQLDEAEEYADQLQARISTLEEEKRKHHISWGDIGAHILMGFLKKNTDKLPALAGLLDDSMNANTAPSQETASYQQSTIDEATGNRLLLLQEMQEKLTEEQIIGVLSIIAHLTTRPEQIQTVISLLHSNVDSAGSAAQ